MMMSNACERWKLLFAAYVSFNCATEDEANDGHKTPKEQRQSARKLGGVTRSLPSVCVTWQSSQVLVFMVEYKRKNAHCDSSVVVVPGPPCVSDDIVIQQCLCARLDLDLDPNATIEGRNICHFFPWWLAILHRHLVLLLLLPPRTDGNKQKL